MFNILACPVIVLLVFVLMPCLSALVAEHFSPLRSYEAYAAPIGPQLFLERAYWPCAEL